MNKFKYFILCFCWSALSLYLFFHQYKDKFSGKELISIIEINFLILSVTSLLMFILYSLVNPYLLFFLFFISCQELLMYIPGAFSFIIIGLILPFLLLYLLRKNNALFIKTSIYLLLPFVIFQIGSDIKSIFSAKHLSYAPFQHKKEGFPKIIWLLFDELDPNFTSNLPEFTKIKNRSFYATNVEQAGNGTNQSIFSLTTGKKNCLKEYSSTIFSKAKDLGFNAAVVGSELPYNSIFGKDLTHCTVATKKTEFKLLIMRQIKDFIKFSGWVLKQKINQFFHINLHVEQFHKITREVSLNTYRNCFEKTKKLCLDENLNFIFIHWSIPHFPTIYNASKKQLCSTSSKESEETTYSDNVALVDVTLKNLKETIGKAVWNHSIIIITSDHWLRTREWTKSTKFDFLTKEELAICNKRTKPLVPFIIKMPNQKKQLLYEKPFNAISLHYIILEMLEGNIKREEDIVNWLNAHAN